MEIVFAPTIKEGSWLTSESYADDEEVQNFLKGFDYAQRCNNFIASAAGLTAEQCFWIWSLVQHGIDNY